MKARTKLERRVLELGVRLPALSKAKREWAFGLFPKYGLYLKKGEVWCQCCGYLDRVLIPELAVSLEVGHTYILRETSSPYGFALSQDIEFTVKDTGEIQKVVMKDELVVGQRRGGG